MKKNQVLAALHDQASLALLGLPMSGGIPLYSRSDSLTVLLALRSVVSDLFGYLSSEYIVFTGYIDAFDGSAFVGPLPVGGSQ